jgi:putative toxin-antitoxin system antitoxin component (TIGR02293 family)
MDIWPRKHAPQFSRSEAGFRFASSRLWSSELKQPAEVWSKILGISTRMMLRNRARSRRLDANISDRIDRVKRIYALTQDVIGGPEKAKLWLIRPNRALQGQVPLELLDTDAGTQIVQEELYRIQYGII